MTPSALHCWVLDNVRPLADAALAQQSAAVGTEEFLIATGIHRGVCQVEHKLLDLLAELYQAERVAVPT